MEIYAVRFLDISKDKLDNLCLLISAEKRGKIKKFINPKDKIRTLIGEILLRTIIVGELGIRNKYVTFAQNRYGKPYLKEYPRVNFNISHSGDYVVCAIDVKPIGIDIEEVKFIEYVKIAKTFFTENEFNHIIKQSSDIQLSKFYEIWTLKESYIKCCGRGLSIPLKSFSIDIKQNKDIEVISNNEHNQRLVVFKRFEIASGYKMAVCSVNKEITNKLTIIDQNILLNNFDRR